MTDSTRPHGPRPHGIERRTGGQAVVDTLVALGARHVVGLPGQHALPMFDALADSPLAYLGARVENNAGFIADGHTRAGGGPTPLLLSAGPGALTVLPAVQEAAAASSPVVVIAAQVPRAGLGGGRHGFLHELDDQRAAFRDIVKGTWSVRSVEQVVPTLTAAWTLAAAAPAGPVYVEMPYDVQAATALVDVPQRIDVAERADAAGPATPTPSAIDTAAALLAEARRPRVYAGGGVVRSGAGPVLLTVAERLAAPVVTTFGGRQAVPWSHPLSAQGWIEDIATTEFLEDADVLLVVGTGLGELSTNYFTFAPHGTLIHIDADARVLGANHPGLPLAGDARTVLEALDAALAEREVAADPTRTAAAEADAARLVATVTARLDAQPLDAERRLLAELRGAIPDEVATYWDMTIAAYWAWSAWDARGGGFENAQCGGLGFGLPGAIGAAFAGVDADHPHGTRTIAISGDGGGLYSIADLATLAQHGLDVTWVVIDDGGYGVLRGYMDAAFGRHPGTDLAVPDYVALAGAFGIPARRVAPDALGEAVRTSLAADGPAVIVVPARLELFAPTHTHRTALLG